MVWKHDPWKVMPLTFISWDGFRSFFEYCDNLPGLGLGGITSSTKPDFICQCRLVITYYLGNLTAPLHSVRYLRRTR